MGAAERRAFPDSRYFGTMGNANFAGGYLGLTCAVALPRVPPVRVRRGSGSLSSCGALVTLYALWLTSARNGMVALAAAVALFLFIHRERVPLDR